MLAGRRHDAAGRAMAGACGGDGMQQVRYQGVSRTADGRWKGYITNRFGVRYDVGHHATAEEAALAHDRAVLAILGPHASPAALNFRAAFSDTELRFLRGPHAPSRRAAGVICMVMRGAAFDAELERFAARAYDAHTDPELALDVAAFRLANRDALASRIATVAAAADGTEAERDVERAAFVAAARNKVHDAAWVRSYLLRRRLIGATFEDENRWPPVVAPPAVDVGDGFAGNELVYLPHGSCHVDEMTFA
ncbi:hypothetical protein E2562_020732 [Oryza meyeriana var. granulata]|uniref:AP2/ERF domain-containing protein n=1 Tax=Oryza meyeriana var. granulata TaxID=110450 RepID=A0A6G1EN82_9ORYZ|nr:hypothetical protein E2562_020732 [Oryza meyeriana var. granulata]